MTPQTFDAQTFEADFQEAVIAGVLTLDDRDEYEAHCRQMSVRLDPPIANAQVWAQTGNHASASVPHPAGLPAAPRPAIVASDPDAAALHARVENYAADNQVDYFTAFQRIAPQSHVETYADPPQVDLEDFNGLEVDPESAQLDAFARKMTSELTVSYSDAAAIAELHDLQAKAAQTLIPSSDVPWLDATALTGKDCPRPWSDEDWERDKRRAAAGGLVPFPDEFDPRKPEWQNAADNGEDLVGQEVKQQRQARIDDLRARRDLLVKEAQQTEATRREKALKDELDRRARERVSTKV